MTPKVTIYGHPFCPMVGPVKRILNQCEVDFEYINIHEDDAARQRVQEINGGNESVPTLVFPDGSTLTEPSTMDLKRKLESMGHEVPFMALVYGNLTSIIMLALLAAMIFKATGVF
jgi:mycoredoxin